MPVEIVVPELGESIVEATVGRWLKKEGEAVKAGEPVVTLETEKVNLEVGAAQSGVIARIERKEGEDVRIGQVLGVIEESPGGPAPAKAEAAKAEAAKAEAAKAEGNGARAAPAAEQSGSVAKQPEPPAQPPVSSDRPASPEVTPVARRLAQDLGVDLAQVTGTGSSGRVTKEDVQAYADKQKSGGEAPQAQPSGPPAGPPESERPAQPEPQTTGGPAPAADRTGREERVRMSRRRRTIAQRLVEAQRTAAMLTTFNEIDMSKVIDIRTRRKEAFQKEYGVGLGFMSFFVKASIGALKMFPQLNAEIDGDEIVLKRYYDIGMAIGAPEGLVVPVLREADRMSFAEIETTIKGFVEKAKNGSLSLDDLRGGTFTLTNGGVFGSLLSTPILNPPQVGILGLHKIEERPVAVEGQVVIRPMMYVALSYDHRLVDGREAVQFLVKLKTLVEDPETLLLEG
jgi:2-oxoglutarate dehydrogenase E2 component (dihydrolipoamide succinyltransferase)